MNITQALKLGTQKIDRIDAMLFLSELLSQDPVYLFAHGEEELRADVERLFFDMVDLRVAGVPAAYIVGHKEFMSMDFKVDSTVLIPRPETEELIQEIFLRRRPETVRTALDIGTGSGCIAAALANGYPDARIVAVDLRAPILRMARKNAVANGVADRIDFIRSDLLRGLPQVPAVARFDVIVSNPPYIRSSVIPSLQREVCINEPMLALDGGPDGLLHIRALADVLPRLLAPGGMAAIEIGWDQGLSAGAIFTARFGSAACVIHDLSRNDRFVLIDLT